MLRAAFKIIMAMGEIRKRRERRTILSGFLILTPLGPFDFTIVKYNSQRVFPRLLNSRF